MKLNSIAGIDDDFIMCRDTASVKLCNYFLRNKLLFSMIKVNVSEIYIVSLKQNQYKRDKFKSLESYNYFILCLLTKYEQYSYMQIKILLHVVYVTFIKKI